MGKAFKQFWKNYAKFKGVTSRKDYWLAWLANNLINLLLIILSGVGYALASASYHGNTQTIIAIIVVIVMGITGIYTLATLIPRISMQVRRIQDAGFHGALVLLHLIPSFGSIAVFILCILPSKLQDNKYRTTNNQNTQYNNEHNTYHTHPQGQNQNYYAPQGQNQYYNQPQPQNNYNNQNNYQNAYNNQSQPDLDLEFNKPAQTPQPQPQPQPQSQATQPAQSVENSQIILDIKALQSMMEREMLTKSEFDAVKQRLIKNYLNK